MDIAITRGEASALLSLLDDLALAVAGERDLDPKYAARYERLARMLVRKLKSK